MKKSIMVLAVLCFLMSCGIAFAQDTLPNVPGSNDTGSGFQWAAYLASLICLVVGFIVKVIIANNPFAKKLKEKESEEGRLWVLLIDALIKPLSWGCFLLGLYLALYFLPFATNKHYALGIRLTEILSILLIVWLLTRISDKLMQYWLKTENADRSQKHLIPVVKITCKLFIMVIGLIFVIQDLGYSVQSLIAGLGIGGLAVAFASKDTLSNIFGSLVLFFDKPFVLGDVIDVGSNVGTVESIGIRSTTIRSLENTLITIPNSKFTDSVITNLTKRTKRKMTMTIGITYSSKQEQIRNLIVDIKALFEKYTESFQENPFVRLNNFADSAIEILIVCHTLTADWDAFTEAKENFMLDIMDLVEKNELEFAFPSQSIYVEKLPEK